MRFDVNCRHCQSYGHKWAECRKRLREEVSSSDNRPQPQQTTEGNQNKTKYNHIDVCQNCGQNGDCRYRIPGHSTCRSVPYNKQTTSESKVFRRDFKLAQNQQHQMNEVNMESHNSSEEEEMNDCYDATSKKNGVGHSKNLSSHAILRLQTTVRPNILPTQTTTTQKPTQDVGSIRRHRLLLLRQRLLCEESFRRQLPYITRDRYSQTRPTPPNSKDD